MNQRIEIKLNLFSNDSVCELGITFEYEKNILSFCLLFWTLGVIFFFENALIDFRVIIGIILLKVAILLDVVSIYKSCGRMRDGKRSCLFTYSTTDRKTYPTCFFSNIYEKVGYSISETPPFDI